MLSSRIGKETPQVEIELLRPRVITPRWDGSPARSELRLSVDRDNQSYIRNGGGCQDLGINSNQRVTKGLNIYLPGPSDNNNESPVADKLRQQDEIRSLCNR